MIMLPGWPEEIHYEPEQLKRLARARHLEPPMAKKALMGKSWKVMGTEPAPYKVTYKKCTCPDFIKRQKPCKHMYYIALRDGFSDTDPQLKPRSERAFDPLKELERLRQLLHSGDIKADQFAALAVALVQLEPLWAYTPVEAKARGRAFQPKKEEARYQDMYKHGDIDMESYIDISEAFRQMRSSKEVNKSDRIRNAVRGIVDKARGIGAAVMSGMPTSNNRNE